MYLIRYILLFICLFFSQVDFMHDILFLCDYLRLGMSVRLFVIYLITCIYLFCLEMHVYVLFDCSLIGARRHDHASYKLGFLVLELGFNE